MHVIEIDWVRQPRYPWIDSTHLDSPRMAWRARRGSLQLEESAWRRLAQGSEADSDRLRIWYPPARKYSDQHNYRINTYSVDTGYLETERTPCIIGPIEIIAHHEDDIEQLSEQFGVGEICASGKEQPQALHKVRSRSPSCGTSVPASIARRSARSEPGRAYP